MRLARVPVTACIITCDEEDNLPDCLASLEGLCAEIVVVDSGSTDRTVDLARRAGARVIETDWPGHVAQKTRAVEAAETDWVLCLDADERLSPELRAEIETVLGGDPVAAAYSFPRLTRYLGRWIRHGGWYPDRKVRLFDRRRGRWGGVDPHDHVEVDGPVVKLRGDLHHHTYRDLSDHLRFIDRYTTIAAKEKRAAGERFRLHRLVLRPVGKVLRMYLLRVGFLDGLAGLVVAVLGGTYVFLKYAKLWELERREKGRSR
jgi:glycosyltransferase involved in cell wall biosynthesis